MTLPLLWILLVEVFANVHATSAEGSATVLLDRFSGRWLLPPPLSLPQSC